MGYTCQLSVIATQTRAFWLLSDQEEESWEWKNTEYWERAGKGFTSTSNNKVSAKAPSFLTGPQINSPRNGREYKCVESMPTIWSKSLLPFPLEAVVCQLWLRMGVSILVSWILAYDGQAWSTIQLFERIRLLGTSVSQPTSSHSYGQEAWISHCMFLTTDQISFFKMC